MMQLLSQPIELHVIKSVLREFLPAKNFESTQKKVDDWDARGRPNDGIGDFLIRMIVGAVDDLVCARKARIEYRRIHVEQAREREVSQALAMGGRLRLTQYAIECMVRPDPPIERGRGDTLQAIVDLTASPAWIVRQLESTAAGCQWLGARWGVIRRFLEPGANWFSEDAFSMVRLMGKTPRDVLKHSEVVEVFLASHAVDRRGSNPFMVLRGELSLDEANDLVRRLGQRVKASPEEGDAEQGRQTLTAMIDRAIADLMAKAQVHEQRTQSDEARKAAEQEFDTSPRGLSLARREKASQRSLKASARTLRRFEL